MKKQLLIVSLFISGLASAQGTMTQANEPVIGATQSMYLCDSSAIDLASTTGAGVTWDFTSVKGIAGEMREFKIVDAANSQYSSDFPGSTKAIEIESFLTTFWTSSATERKSKGYVFNEVTFGVVKGVFDIDDQILVTYPFALNNTVSDTYQGALTFDFQGMPQNPDATGVSLATIDGEGTLKLNAATTIANVIRYKMVDTLLTNVMIVGDVEVIRIQYEYYNAQGGMPLFTHSRIIMQAPGATTPLAEITMILSSVMPDQMLATKELNSLQFGIYPNPVKESFTIQGNFSGEFTAEILDQTGKIVQVVENGFAGKAIETASLKAGIYFVKVASSEGTATQKFVKQ